LQPAGVVSDTYTVSSGPFIISIKSDRIEFRVWAPESEKGELLAEARAVVESLGKVLSIQYSTALEVMTPTVETYHADKLSRDIEMSATGGNFAVMMGSADFIIRDAQGNVIDSSEMRRERVRQEERRRVLFLANRGSEDTALREMLHYRQEYETDQIGRLHHLFDLLQVAERVYHGRPEAADKLHILEKDLDRLGSIANDENLTNGRHPGRSPGPHRRATPEEISTCERVADAIIDARAGFRQIP
jgi:hypothetical protein